ncbi:Hypothetical protein D9617_25g060680 [Elsinoe fawcettii]|nr:Hypothetical protein D9617_25g060680 [Elsinoe fawcettii]
MVSASTFATIFSASVQSINTALQQIRDYEIDALPGLPAVYNELRELERSYYRTEADLSDQERKQYTSTTNAILEETERLRNFQWPQREVPPEQRLPWAQAQKFLTCSQSPEPYNRLPQVSSVPHHIETGAIPQSISNETSQHVILEANVFGPSTPQPVTLRHIVSSLIDIRSPFRAASVTANNIQSSLLLLGHVSETVELISLRGCTVVVSADKVYIRESTDVTIYLYSASQPVIEDSTDVHFTEAPPTLVRTEEADVSRQEHGGQVVDLSWDGDSASPNWTLLTEVTRIADADWEAILRRGDEEEIDVLLRRAGVDVVAV